MSADPATIAAHLRELLPGWEIEPAGTTVWARNATAGLIGSVGVYGWLVFGNWKGPRLDPVGADTRLIAEDMGHGWVTVSAEAKASALAKALTVPR
jgi:hypothetical protein